MGSALHLILLFSGLWTLTLCASRQFYLVEQNMNWTKAQHYCRARYTDLATIENEKEMETVRDLLQGKEHQFWIGLEQNQTVSNRSWSWSDGTLSNYSNWNYGEPNNAGSDNCAELSKPSRKWNDANCSHPIYFVCYRHIPLIVIPQEKTWSEALRYCRQNYVDLVSVSSHEMQERVAVVVSNSSAQVWIGLRHTCTLGFWYWVTGEMICYQNWAEGNGTGEEDCDNGERTGAMLTSSKKWISLPETSQLPFICITF